MLDSIVILGAARTPMGAFQGDFASLSANDLGGAAIRAAVERSGVALQGRPARQHRGGYAVENVWLWYGGSAAGA